MKLGEISKQVFELIIPFLKSKSLKQVSNEIGEAVDNTILEIWENVKYIFIKEEAIEDLKENPDDEDLLIELKSKFKRELKKNEDLQKKLNNLLINLQVKPLSTTTINQSKNVLIGNINNIEGNITIGDKK